MNEKVSLLFRNMCSELARCMDFRIREIYIYFDMFSVGCRMPDVRFVIFTHGRSGGSLLVDLLNSNQNIHCEDEILLHKLIFPKRYVERRSIRSPKSVYGFKVLLNQLDDKFDLWRHYYFQPQNGDPEEFLLHLYENGWKIIYLKRENVLRQSISDIAGRGQNQKQFHYRFSRGSFKTQSAFRRSISVILGHRWKQFHHKCSEGPLKIKSVSVSCRELLGEIEKREKDVAEAERILKNIPHETVVYERDFLNSKDHQKTMNRLFDYLEVPRHPVVTDFVRTSKDDVSEYIENWEQVKKTLSDTKYAKYL